MSPGNVIGMFYSLLKELLASSFESSTIKNENSIFFSSKESEGLIKFTFSGEIVEIIKGLVEDHEKADDGFHKMYSSKIRIIGPFEIHVLVESTEKAAEIIYMLLALYNGNIHEQKISEANRAFLSDRQKEIQGKLPSTDATM